MIRMEHLSKSYRANRVIADLSLHIEEGEKTAFIAPSGYGKTTLFRLIAGLEKPDGGTVRVDGPIAYVFQEPRLLKEFTVLENVKAVVEGKNREERAKRRLEQVGMSAHLDKYPDKISGGMAQRTVLARALASERRIFLLDEPFKGLDEESKQTLIGLLRSECEDKTLLLITHDEEEAAALCTRILTFDKRMVLSNERIRPVDSF